MKGSNETNSQQNKHSSNHKNTKKQNSIYNIEHEESLDNTNGITLHEKSRDVSPSQNNKIDVFFDMYMYAINNVGKVDPELLKRNFDDYIETVELKFLNNIDYAFCDTNDVQPSCALGKYKANKHPDHDVEYLNELGDEFYVLFKILDVMWKNEEILHKDIEYLTPCRVFLMYSVIKRKYNVELDVE